jgi:hypothetical protein
MLTFVNNLFDALGQDYTPPQEGAVGFGSVNIPGSATFVTQLLQYASTDNSLHTPLGRMKIQALKPLPGIEPALLITGTIAGRPFSFSPLIPDKLIDFAKGRPTRFGAVELTGTIDLPEITFKSGPSGGEATLMFDHPIHIAKHVDARAGFIRRRFSQMLQTNMLGIKINSHHGTPILSGAANWLAPQLIWS